MAKTETDRRLTPANERVALAALRGRVEAPRYVAGEPATVAVPLVDLCRSPDGARERQVLLGDALTVIERRAGWCFVQAAKDGFCGYLPETALGPPAQPTHWLAAASSHLYPEPRLKVRETAALPFGAWLEVTGEEGGFAVTRQGFVPLQHLRPLDQPLSDPVAVAALFLGAPYLWGGNSRAGIDCSGLVQAALLACGTQCPGDSDLQQAVGRELAEDEPLQAGDLLFWQGHVAMVADAARIIHATAHYMAVVYEDIGFALSRIAAAGYPVIARRRP